MRLTVKTYHALIMDALHGDRQCANQNQQFFYGISTSVERKATGAKITYRWLSFNPLRLKALQYISLKICIDKGDGQNVLDCAEWFIRKINMSKALMKKTFTFNSQQIT
ncbi:MAG: hypothetical protein LBF68_03305 [Christensenellaceae bacterium]|nr:hypothetical protein [Christensenellaceae bacterium]